MLCTVLVKHNAVAFALASSLVVVQLLLSWVSKTTRFSFILSLCRVVPSEILPLHPLRHRCGARASHGGLVAAEHSGPGALPPEAPGPDHRAALGGNEGRLHLQREESNRYAAHNLRVLCFNPSCEFGVMASVHVTNPNPNPPFLISHCTCFCNTSPVIFIKIIYGLSIKCLVRFRLVSTVLHLFSQVLMQCTRKKTTLKHSPLWLSLGIQPLHVLCNV